MNIIKGFVSINQYTNNAPNLVSKLAEISTWSLTYSKDVGEYYSETVPGYRLLTFKSVDASTGNAVTLTDGQVTEALDLVRECLAYGTGHIRPYDPVDFRNVLLAKFFEKVGDINFGEFIDDGFKALPAWISWTSLDNDNSYVKVWLADSAFIDQYDEYSITVIPPLAALDGFFGSYSQAVTSLNSRTVSGLADAIQTAKDGSPETYLRIMDYNFINPLNVSQSNSTHWAVLIYGKAGDYVDAIKDAIVEYVLANSEHTRSEWEAILPDLFKRTEFIVLPRWDKVSIPNLTELAGLYSSILDPVECIQFAKQAIGFYSQTFIESNINILPYDYKAISLVVVNGANNVVGKQKLAEMFYDYLPVQTTSTDFSRMLVKTRDWVLLIERMLIVAETATLYSTIPTSMRRITRGDSIYITAMYDGVNYLVAAKSNAFYD